MLPVSRQYPLGPMPAVGIPSRRWFASSPRTASAAPQPTAAAAAPPPAPPRPPTAALFAGSVVEFTRNPIGRTAAELEFAKSYFTNPRFCGSATSLDTIKFLEKPLPEVAFVGRSNVGKSTLINSVLGSNLARVSNVPGRTQTLNWYAVRDKLYVVDLPGYGFAQAPKDVQAAWRAFMGDYLRAQRKPYALSWWNAQLQCRLRRVFLLVDGRLGIQNIDLEMCELLHQNSVPHQIVCTKADKATAAELSKAAQTVKKYLNKASICFPKLIFTSCLRRRGIEDLRSDILTACGIEVPNQQLREAPPELLAKSQALEQSDPEAHLRHKAPKKKLQKTTPLIDLPVTARSSQRAPRRR